MKLEDDAVHEGYDHVSSGPEHSTEKLRIPVGPDNGPPLSSSPTELFDGNVSVAGNPERIESSGHRAGIVRDAAHRTPLPSLERKTLMNGSWSEHGVAPAAVIVHDPTMWDAFDAFSRNPELTREHLLFQDIPDAEAYAEDLKVFHAELEGVVDQLYHLRQLDDDLENETLFAANPNHVYARDSAVTLPWAPRHFIPCNMARAIRRNEPRVMARAMTSLGLTPLLQLPGQLHLEGGDVIPFGYDDKRCLVIGHGPRTDLATVEYLAEHLIPQWVDEIVAFRLSPRRINLDGTFCPVDEDLVVVNLESLLDARRYDPSGSRSVLVRRTIEELGLALVEVSFEDSLSRQACNCFCAGNGRVVMYDLCPHVAEALAKAGLSVTVVPGAELVKGIGGPRCMTRPIYS